MKIGIVCYPTFGGSGVVATELGMALAKNGHEVHFITYSQPARLNFFEERVYYHEVTVSSYPLFEYPPYEVALAGKITDVALYEKLDVLHVHYAIPHASAAYMARKILETKGIYLPVLTTLHGTDISLVGKDASFEPVVTFSINNSTGVTAVSENLKQETYSLFNITKEIKVIPNFVDLTRFKKIDNEYFKHAIAPGGERLVVHISNFREVKRVEDVVLIFDKIRKKIPSKLLLVGDGPDRAKAEKLCRDLGACDDIRFLGKITKVEEVLSLCDLFLLPSEKESFGLAALEAMACHVPVVSSNTGGIPELNIHGQTGFVSAVGDIDTMANHSLFVLSEDNLALFKKNAFAQAQKFDISKIMPMYEACYEKLVSSVNQEA